MMLHHSFADRDTSVQSPVENDSLVQNAVLIVIVNYRTAQLTIDCLHSLETEARSMPGTRVVVVDNVSGDRSVEIIGSAIAEAGWDWVSVLPSDHNGGKLLSKWVVAQTMTDQPQQIDWLPGASMMIRRQVFESIGLMDEEYFLYYEETDFCLQAKRAGWECWYVPQSRVMHIAGQSTGVTSKEGSLKRLPQYLFESRQRYFVKNHGLFYAALVDLVWSIGFILWRLRQFIQRKPDTDPPYLLWDSLRNSVFFTLGKRSPTPGYTAKPARD